MKLDVKGDKGFRLLYMQEFLKNGGVLRKAAMAQRFGVTDKTIQRDIGDLREYFRCTNQDVELKYDRKKNGYLLVYLK